MKLKNQKGNNKEPWPTKKVMDQIYDQNLWGGKKGEFYSGEGSHNPLIIAPYINSVKTFLQSFDQKISVCDLGCGDFNVGKQLVDFTSEYIGVDIVDELINHNKKVHKSEGLTFQNLDVSKDNLPKADCVVIRQVLQHLSNYEIIEILKKLDGYKYAIITEHLPEGEFNPNIDKIASLGVRLNHNSGVVIEESPFNFQFKSKRRLLSVKSVNWKGVIVTDLFLL